MEIKGEIYCLFEQSGVFRDEFRKLGYVAHDYDIQNTFGQTDFQTDLFDEIERAYDGDKSLFDEMVPQTDLCMAFFPCIYFCESNTRLFRFEDVNNRCHSRERAVGDMLERSRNRQRFWELALKMFAVADTRGIRMIVENPYSPIHFLTQYFPYRPAMIDHNRQLRGDYFRKPTQYWFINCEPTYGRSFQAPKEKKLAWRSKPASTAGQCSAERSLISPDYARNFICDFILGKKQEHTQLTLF